MVSACAEYARVVFFFVVVFLLLAVSLCLQPARVLATRTLSWLTRESRSLPSVLRFRGLRGCEGIPASRQAGQTGAIELITVTKVSGSRRHRHWIQAAQLCSMGPTTAILEITSGYSGRHGVSDEMSGLHHQEFRLVAKDRVSSRRHDQASPLRFCGYPQSVHSSSGMAFAWLVYMVRWTRPFVVKDAQYATTWTTSSRDLGWSSQRETRYPQAPLEEVNNVRDKASLDEVQASTELEPSKPEILKGGYVFLRGHCAN